MKNDVAIFLDLDNVVIGAEEAGLIFDINLVVAGILSSTNGRIVLRRAYGDWRQRANLTKELASAGFELQSTVRLSSSSKNLADMQMVVDAMGTLIDGRDFNVYALISGDRDFSPLVQALQKRGKEVIGVGIRHASSSGLVQLCDRYIFYDELAADTAQVLEEQMEEFIQRAVDQLLQDKPCVPASLLKQRIQALSKGVFAKTPDGKRSFRKLLAEHPDIIELKQEGTTLYVCRPGSQSNHSPETKNSRQLSEDEAVTFLTQALDEELTNKKVIRASLLKQRMQEMSEGAFDEERQGDKTFRKFLERHGDIVTIGQEGSTLYVQRPEETGELTPSGNGRPLGEEEAETLLYNALNDLLVDQDRARASLLKQRMQTLSDGVFDESLQGDKSFKDFLERYPALVSIQQRGTTLLVSRPDGYVDKDEIHLHYRSILKKNGLRVVPSEIRLTVLKDMITLLQHLPTVTWRNLVDQLAAYYGQKNEVDISRSFINDVLRVARRAGVIAVENGKSLANAEISLILEGDRIFQEAVIKCDVTYLREIESAEAPVNMEAASLALYETSEQGRYLGIILSRYSENALP